MGGMSSTGGGTSSSTTGGDTGGSGSGGGMGGAGGGIFTGGGPGCEAFDQVGCLDNFPECVPVYDDACCPSCEPGGCADCTELQFHHCTPKETGCGSDPVPCGVVPDWACAGSQAKCNIDPGGSLDACSMVAGCVGAECSPDLDCDLSPICVPVTKDICGPILCNAIPPACPAGMTNEVVGGCFTSFCVPASLCPPIP
jgi:hypothetical protein